MCVRLYNDALCMTAHVYRLTFIEGLGAGSKEHIYPVLAFLLQRFPQLSKRAYVARFMVPHKLPP